VASSAEPVVRDAEPDDVAAICWFGEAHIRPHYAPLIGAEAADEQVRRWWNNTQVGAAVTEGLVVLAEADGQLVGVGQRGRPLAKDQLAEMIWGEALPRKVAATIESYVSLLRSRLGAASALIATETGGYRAELGGVQVDVDAFDSLVRDAAGAPPAQRRQPLEAALAIATAEVLEDEPYAEWAMDLRRMYAERRLQATCDLGDHGGRARRAQDRRREPQARLEVVGNPGVVRLCRRHSRSTRRAEQRDAALLRQLREHRRSRSRAARHPDHIMEERLPSAREDEPEVSGRRCSDHVAVRNPSRSEDEEPLPGVEPIVAHRHLIASLQHIERLVLALVDMWRGAGPLGCGHLHQAEQAAGLGA
jgi:hypothetical protein